MKCKSCKREIEDDSIFCRHCGEKVVKTKREKSAEIKVPKPRQLPSGTWFAQVTVNGERIPVSAPTEQEYYTKARAIKAGLIEASAQKRMTVGQAVDAYIAKAKADGRSPSTIKGYKSYRANRFQGIMDKDINTAFDWKAIIGNEKKTKSAKTVINAFNLVSASIKAQGVNVPTEKIKKKKAERPWLDYEQIQTFCTAIKGKPVELAALLALHSLRRSELLDVTWKDIDLKARTITVSGAAVYDENGNFVHKDQNKTEGSARTIPIMIPRLLELLEDDTDHQPWGYVEQSKPNTTYVRVNKICAAIDLPKVGVHGLRHSFASLAYHLGWSELTTMEIGGWSSPDVVHEIYTHLAKQDKQKDIKRMTDFYSGNVQIANENANAGAEAQ